MEGGAAMRILALDSSSPVASVAVVSFQDGAAKILFEENTPHARSDSSALFHALEAAVYACGKPDALCVGLGPGSYNGLRAGIAAARGFATALALPLHAIPSPLALPGPDSGFWAVGDARGGHYWIARISNGHFLEEPRLLLPGDALAHASTQDIPILSAGPLGELLNPVDSGLHASMVVTIATPGAHRLAILAEKKDPSYLVPLTPEPLYLKPPHITVPKAFVATR
jgi:tRNA threonylcarbamoyl adenosine modification protein YeaZ